MSIIICPIKTTILGFQPTWPSRRSPHVVRVLVVLVHQRLPWLHALEKCTDPHWQTQIGSNWITGWWLTYPSEKYERPLGWWHSQYFWENKSHVPVATNQIKIDEKRMNKKWLQLFTDAISVQIFAARFWSLRPVSEASATFWKCWRYSACQIWGAQNGCKGLQFAAKYLTFVAE